LANRCRLRRKQPDAAARAEHRALGCLIAALGASHRATLPPHLAPSLCDYRKAARNRQIGEARLPTGRHPGPDILADPLDRARAQPRAAQRRPGTRRAEPARRTIQSAGTATWGLDLSATHRTAAFRPGSPATMGEPDGKLLC